MGNSNRKDGQLITRIDKINEEIQQKIEKAQDVTRIDKINEEIQQKIEKAQDVIQVWEMSRNHAIQRWEKTTSSIYGGLVDYCYNTGPFTATTGRIGINAGLDSSNVFIGRNIDQDTGLNVFIGRNIRDMRSDHQEREKQEITPLPSAPPSEASTPSEPSAPPSVSEDTEDKYLCVVCLNQQKNYLFMPCKHLACCLNCSNQVIKCPICRAFIQEKILIFT